MAKQSFLAALFGALLSTAAFAVSPLPRYIIETDTGGDTPVIQFSVTRSGGSLAIYPSIKAAIDAIMADATSTFGTNPFFAIQFETDTKVLDIGTAMVTFEGGTGNITLMGKITSASGGSMVEGPAGTVIIKSGISVESIADIENTMSGNAISVAGGQAKIVGGTVKANSGNAIDFPITGGGGSVVLGGSPTITGNMQVRTGALSVDPTFAPAGQYTLLIYGAAGGVAVGGGANFLSNFTLAANSGNLILEKSGNDLVLATPSNSSSSNCGLVECLHPSSSSVNPSSSSSGGGSSSSSVEPVPIAYNPSPTIHSEIPTYYTMKGEPVGSTKPAKPGVYLVKQGSSVRKIVVR
ncbi:MAG: hypothetical protein LBQ76_06030 [Candidatus Fibromonas sp.]|jgi:hypothetical protein|nr:hypothetical protein [Candidatus Fibromonas sp.]